MMGKETLHRVMYGLLYPAVLGSVFVIFISDDLSNFGFYPRMIFGFIFVYHWTLQFAFASAEHRIAKYSLSKFFGDILLIIGMNLAYYALPNSKDFIKGPIHYDWFYFGLFVIGLSFISRELYDWAFKQHRIRKAPFIINNCLLFGGLTLFVLSRYSVHVSLSSLLCFITIFSTLLASILDTLFSKQIDDYQSLGK